MNKRAAIVVGCVLMLVGAVLAVVPLFGWGSEDKPVYLIVGLALMAIGAGFAAGLIPKVGLGFGKASLQIAFQEGSPAAPKQLAPDLAAQRRAFARQKVIPGAGAPTFDAIEVAPAHSHAPTSHPTVPMYMLDSSFRILDWNEAFTLAFDRTMEGRRGMSVLEWVYLLDNYEEVLEHGTKAFADPDNFPVIDVEPLKYTSMTYGELTATKRAYQIPADDGSCFGWLVTLEPTFADPAKWAQYQWDVVQALREDLMWSEYAVSYDRVLTNTDSYPKLLGRLLGEQGDLPAVPPNTRVLDLGAGTGNLTLRLAEPAKDRLVVALELNDTMLGVLRGKCSAFLRDDDDGPGIIAIKQDIRSLFGLQDAYFDYAFANNVLYFLDDPAPCLRETLRVLKPGGEVRISGPKKNTSLDRLFRAFRRELKAKSLYDELRRDLEEVEALNQHALSRRLFRWDVEDVKELLVDAGFGEITYATDRAYAGQAMIVCARK